MHVFSKISPTEVNRGYTQVSILRFAELETFWIAEPKKK